MGLPSGTVTLLFSDIEGSFRLWERDHDAMEEALAGLDRIVREHVRMARGHVFKTVGDVFCAVFADPSAALASAIAIQRAAGVEPWPPTLPIAVRMALHSGDAVERRGDYYGPVVNRVARLLDAGHGGQVLVSGATYELLADRLNDGIGLRDLGEHHLKDLGRAERVFQAAAAGLAERFGPLRSLGDVALRHNLPLQASSFIGRATELAELGSLVSGRSRLVTIVGPGGIGKTRLALQVAAETVDGTGDGVWMVELAGVADPELVPDTVAAVLQVREEPGRPVIDTLLDAVGDRYLMMVLDNTEHVLGAAAKLADALLRSCPRVCLLVTSREPLGINGEHVFRVPSLTVPPVGVVDPDRLAGFESVQLFVERASTQRQGFALDEANAAPVAAVCARLDGIPLALELAAAHLGSMSVSQINSRLDQRFRLLTRGSRTALPRHQTLRAMIDWSYGLLNPDERIVADRLSVFAGGWTLEAAEAVVSGGGIEEIQVLDRLAALVDKSLVQADDAQNSTRYRQLETVRHYAGERLAERAGAELQVTRKAHRDHYLAMVETAERYLRGAGQAGWLDRLEVEIDNIRAALAFSVADSDDADPGLRLAAGLRWYCTIRGHGGEILDALGALLERPEAQGPTLTRARALNVKCELLYRYGDGSGSTSIANEAVRIARGLGSRGVLADALCQLSWSTCEHGDLAAARAQIDEAVGIARTTGDRSLLAYTLTGRVLCEGQGDEWAAALADLEETLALARATGDDFGLATTLGNLGVVKVALGETRAARGYLEEAGTLARDRGYRNLVPAIGQNLGLVDIIAGDPASARHHFMDSLAAARLTGVTASLPGAFLGLALAVGMDGDPAVAATLHGVADECYGQAGRAFEALEAGLRDRDQARLRATLGEAAFEAAYRHGRTVSQADAMALASPADEPDLRVVAGARPHGRPASGQPSGGLSEREREILALVAGGATDAQIAKRLFVSVHTVRSHLDRIRDKTGARRRAELAQYAIQAGIESVVSFQ